MTRKAFYSLSPEKQAKRRKKEARLLREKIEKLRRKRAKKRRALNAGSEES